MIFIAWTMSNNRKKIEFRVVISGVLLQFLLAVAILKTDTGRMLFEYAKNLISLIIDTSDYGAEFVFGKDFRDHFFAFKVLPTIVFASSLSYVLFYVGVLQKVVQVLSWVMLKVMNVSGAVSLVSAANVFLGQTEAPLFVKPYLKSMTKSELFTMMVGGMATVAGGVLAAFVGFGISAGHLLAASLMSAPAAIVIARVMFPETEHSSTEGQLKVELETDDVNIFDAACRGASDGLGLALNVGAMLLAFIALVKLVNIGIGYAGDLVGLQLSLESMVGFVFRPVAFMLGISWKESAIVGQLIGSKIVLNEFIAYIELSRQMELAQAVRAGTAVAEPGVTYLSERAIIISTYALCGFANFSSMAIQIGGIGGLEPSRKKEFAQYAFKAMIGGSLAAFMTACIAGMLL